LDGCSSADRRSFGRLAAFIEGSFIATMFIDKDAAYPGRRGHDVCCERDRSGNSVYHFELIKDLIWLASGKKTFDFRTLGRRYLEEKPSEYPMWPRMARKWICLNRRHLLGCAARGDNESTRCRELRIPSDSS
jgi:hypothetical protein